MFIIDREKLDRYLNGNYSADDEKYIREIFGDDTKKDALKSLMGAQWKDFQDYRELPEKNLDHILHQVHYRINTETGEERTPLRVIGRWYYRIAAVIFIPLLLSLIIFLIHSSKEIDGSKISWLEIRSTMGSRVSFNLPDGSTAWLNSGSTLRYASDFENNRNVELVGEAYFDVVPDKTRPFLVQASDIRIKVLGTKFNVKSYPDDNTIETTLLTGLVEIETIPTQTSGGRKITLKPNQKVVFEKQRNELSVFSGDKPETHEIKDIRIYEMVNTTPVTSWKDEKLVFINEPFESLLKKMERWYDVEIILKDSGINSLSYTGVFEKETVEQALRALKIATPKFDYSINKNTINVTLK